MKILSAVLMTIALLCSPAVAADRRSEVPLADSPAWGPADAPVTVVEFINFQ